MSSAAFVNLSNPLPQESERKKSTFTVEKLILKYVHKKFGVATVKEYNKIRDEEPGHTSCIKEEKYTLNTILSQHHHKQDPSPNQCRQE
jgi:hypothetical protein